MPPDVPPERVAALRQAFDRTVKDADFLAEAKKSNSDIIYASGPEVEQLVDTVLGAPKEAIARLRDAMVQRSGGRCEEFSGAKSCAKKKKKKGKS
jgi:tripartite-type tricarboxylate transporter receptor subunit TctC